MRVPIPISAAPPRRRLASDLEALAAAHVLVFVAIVSVSVGGFAVGLTMGAWVTPLGVLLAVVALRAFARSWRHTFAIAAATLAVHVAAGLVAFAFPDNSWDGLAYHQEGALRLAAGWNPVFESAEAYGNGQELYLNHYPNASWTAAAAVLLTTGFIEPGKLFNITLMVAAASQAGSALLRLTPLSPIAVGALAVLAAANPVFIYQSVTFYVDNLLGSALTMMVAGLAVFVASRRPHALAIALLAAAVAITVKLTGLVYAVALLAAAVAVMWAWQGRRDAWRLAAVAAAAGLFTVAVLGYAPYVRNVLEHGDPFYPATPAHGLVNPMTQVPANLRDRDRLTRFVVSSFSHSETVRPHMQTRLKFPLWIAAVERRGLYGADLESGGFGPLYGATLLLALAGAIAAWRWRPARAVVVAALVISACIVLSMFVHAETWWARYVPQAWLLPLLFAVACLSLPRRSAGWWIGCSLVALVAVNLAVVGVNVAWRQGNYIFETRKELQQMAAQPVDVYFGHFRALRRRLDERGVDYHTLEAPPADVAEFHRFPAPGQQAFWRASLRAAHER